jgi:effector-binding domain-containing protein
MEKLKSFDIVRPEFVSEVVIKARPEMMAVCLSGRGDPMETFDEKAAKVHVWLKRRGIEPAGPTFGIYYKDRGEVGVENVEWDACVPVGEKAEAERDLKLQKLPGAEVVSAVLTGGYDLIGDSIDYLRAVSQANDIKTRWPLTEIYLEEGEEPVTELQYFVER